MVVSVEYLVLEEAAALCLSVDCDRRNMRNRLKIRHMLALNRTLHVCHWIVPLPFLGRLASNVTIEQLLLYSILLLKRHVSDLGVSDRAETTL